MNKNNDTISRQAAIDATWEEPTYNDPLNVLAEVRDRLKALPSAQPEITLESAIDYLHSIGWMQEHDRVLTESAQPDLDEWCTDCKEYDQEKHCCPRWNRVIRETAEEVRQNAEPRWIPVEERLPEDERYVLVTTVSGNVTEAKYWQKEGFWVLKGLAIMSVTAWMHLPQPYERSEDD